MDIIVDLNKLISQPDLDPAQVEVLEQTWQAKVKQGRLPAAVVELFWDALSWGDPDWELPPELTWRALRENAGIHISRDLEGD